MPRLRAVGAEAAGNEIVIDLACAMQRWRLPSVFFEVVGEHGRMAAINPILPQVWHRLTIERDGRRSVESFSRAVPPTCISSKRLRLPCAREPRSPHRRPRACAT